MYKVKSMGQKIKELRNKKDLTQQELADKMNVSISTISLYEGDKRKPGISALARLGEALGVDPSYFVSEIKVGSESDLSPRVAKIARDMESLTDEDINFVANIIANLEKNKE